LKMIDNEWMEFARQDYHAVVRLQDDEYLANIVLFHCQQCIEKLLKGVLEANGIDIPRIHSTKKLYTLAATRIDKEICLEDLEFIDSVYIESRYPASIGLLPNGQPTKKESQKAFLIVERILDALDLDFDSVNI
jgi:HEPN domain-containing protein